MSFLDSVMNTVSDALGFGGDSGDDSTSLESMYNTPYKTESGNWYKPLPYGFRFTSRNNKSFICYLPLAPENITISTHFGTNVIPTLYGTIEEHSEQRYYDIVLSGTTGFMPKYTRPFKVEGGAGTPEDLGKTGRKSYKDDPSNAGIDPNLAGGFMQRSIGALNQGLNTINNMAETFVGVQVNSGVDPQFSGYMAFHNLYKFLLAYKKDASGNGTKRGYRTHPLTFLNYKDCQQYDCAIMKFDLKRSAAQPHLYNYTIVMRAYNLKDINAPAVGYDLEADRLEALGLTGVSNSAFSQMRATSNGARGLVGAASGGLNVFGG